MPHKIQNFGNSVADISVLGQFCAYLQFRREKYLNTFIVTNTNDCPNLLSHGATFRMGVLLPNYPRYTSLGPAQAKCYMGTSNSYKSMCSKLILDHAGEWHSVAKSVQVDQIYVKDQIYSNRSQTDRVHEQPVNRTRDS